MSETYFADALITFDPQGGEPHPALIEQHLEIGASKFRGLMMSLNLGPHLSAALAHLDETEEGCIAPSYAIAMHVVATVWRSLVPTWDDRLANRRERPAHLRHEAEILESRVEALCDFDLLIARYKAVLAYELENHEDVLSNVAAAEATTALLMGWTESDARRWTNEIVPGLSMTVEEMGPGCWCWHVTGGGANFRATYGATDNLQDSMDKAVEAVTGNNPAEMADPLLDYGTL